MKKLLITLLPLIALFSFLFLALSTCTQNEKPGNDTLIIDRNSNIDITKIEKKTKNEILTTIKKVLSSSSVLQNIFGLQPITIDYPENNSIFPPDLVPPQIFWHDAYTEDSTNTSTDISEWVIEISFTSTNDKIYILTKPKPITLPQFAPEDPFDFKPSAYQLAAKRYTIPTEIWNQVKIHALEKSATIKIYGLNLKEEKLLSQGQVNFLISQDPVNASLFYRLVNIDKEGSRDIKLMIRDLNQPKPSIVMDNPPTCVNCHSFTNDGKYIGMDVDGPESDKGTYGIIPIQKRVHITDKMIITWNKFHEKLGHGRTIGFMSTISPTGKYIVSTVKEKVFDIGYPSTPFPMGFFPFQGWLAYMDVKTREIKSIPVANSDEYVHAGAGWTADEKYIAFSRAKALPIDPDTMEVFKGFAVKILKDEPQYSGDPKEPQLKYDLYRIPFNQGKGGTAEPIEGASNNGMSNSFPKYSPNGKWLVFVQAKNALLMRPDSRLYIIPSNGGKARELIANKDPMNSWHSWSPNSRWLVFSSKRNTPYTQLFLTHIDENGMDSPAILIPNSTPINRASNIPEFVNIKAEEFQEMIHPYDGCM